MRYYSNSMSSSLAQVIVSLSSLGLVAVDAVSTGNLPALNPSLSSGSLAASASISGLHAGIGLPVFAPSHRRPSYTSLSAHRGNDGFFGDSPPLVQLDDGDFAGDDRSTDAGYGFFVAGTFSPGSSVGKDKSPMLERIYNAGGSILPRSQTRQRLPLSLGHSSDGLDEQWNDIAPSAYYDHAESDINRIAELERKRDEASHWLSQAYLKSESCPVDLQGVTDGESCGQSELNRLFELGLPMKDLNEVIEEFSKTLDDHEETISGLVNFKNVVATALFYYYTLSNPAIQHALHSTNGFMLQVDAESFKFGVFAFALVKKFVADSIGFIRQAGNSKFLPFFEFSSSIKFTIGEEEGSLSNIIPDQIKKLEFKNIALVTKSAQPTADFVGSADAVSYAARRNDVISESISVLDFFRTALGVGEMISPELKQKIKESNLAEFSAVASVVTKLDKVVTQNVGPVDQFLLGVQIFVDAAVVLEKLKNRIQGPDTEGNFVIEDLSDSEKADLNLADEEYKQEEFADAIDGVQEERSGSTASEGYYSAVEEKKKDDGVRRKSRWTGGR